MRKTIKKCIVILLLVISFSSETSGIVKSNTYATNIISINGYSLSNLGISGDIISYATSYRNYDWYYDQGNSGYYSIDNCGPACATMAVKWANPNFNRTVKDARNKYLLNGEWWSTETIVKYLNDNDVSSYYTDYIYSEKQIKKMISNNEIAIVCINTYYLDYTHDNNNIVGRFYTPSVGHFVVIKGYLETSEDFYVEVYDPYSMGLKNNFGKYMGEFRYYTIDELNEAIKNKWEYMIVID